MELTDQMAFEQNLVGGGGFSFRDVCVRRVFRFAQRRPYSWCWAILVCPGQQEGGWRVRRRWQESQRELGAAHTVSCRHRKDFGFDSDEIILLKAEELQTVAKIPRSSAASSEFYSVAWITASSQKRLGEIIDYQENVIKACKLCKSLSMSSGKPGLFWLLR